MRAEIKKLQKDLGVTTIYVTHDQVEAMTMADGIAILNSGVLQQVGSPSDIYRHPNNVFVAGFIGSPPMNFLDCTFKEKSGSYFLDAGSFIFHLSDDIGELIKDKAASSELILGVRPEDILIEKKHTEKAFINGKVFVTEPMGAEMIINIKVGDEILKVRSSPEFDVNIEDEVWLGFNENKIHIFDKKTEEAIL